MKARLLQIVVILIVIAAAGYYIRAKYFTTEAPRYIAAPVTVGTVSQTVLASGILKPVKLVAVGAQVSGRITSLKVKLGDEVKQGDLIAEIDSVTEENDLKKAKAALSNVQAQLAEKEADLHTAQLTLQRQTAIFNQNAGSRADFETAQSTVKATEAQIEAIKAQIIEAEVAIATEQANLDYTRVSAPINGTVLAIVNQEGRTVNANQSAPTIVILGDLDTMTVRAEVSEADIVRVHPGQKVYYDIIGEPDKQYEAKLEGIEPAPESITSDSAVASSTSTSSSSSSTSSSAIYYIGVFNIDNKERKFRTYMTAEVKIVLGEAKDVLTIPSSALGAKDADGSYIVKVVSRGQPPEDRKVKIGLNNKTLAEVQSGLEKGERVVIGQASESSAASTSTRRGGPPPMGF